MTNKFELAKATAEGRWEEYLEGKLGLDLNDGKPTECPLCGGEDRFTFDDKLGQGNWYCRGPKAEHGKRQPHYGDGIKLAAEYLTKVTGQEVTASGAASDILYFFDVQADDIKPEQVQQKKEAKRQQLSSEAELKRKQALAFFAEGIKSAKAEEKETPEDYASVSLANHPYLKRKGLSKARTVVSSQVGTAIATPDTGISGHQRCVTVSYADLETGNLCGVELIAPDGTKRTVGKKGTHILPYLQTATKALVVEGFATGVALQLILRDTGLDRHFRVFIAGGCSKAPAVAEQIKQHRELPAYVIYENDGAGTPEGELYFPVFNGGNDCADWMNNKQPVAELTNQLKGLIQ